MEKASDGSFARTTRKTVEDEGRGREGLGQDAAFPASSPSLKAFAFAKKIGQILNRRELIELETLFL